MVATLAGVWMIVGLFLDGLAHVELRPDSFFTLWHLILYSGFLAAAAATVVPVIRRHRSRASWSSAVPSGHRLTLIGVATFGAGAVLDLVWHQTVGFEVSNEALLSPSHLVLMFGALLALSGPVRSGWANLSSFSSLASWVPMVISLALLTGVALFFTSYLTPFGRQSAATFPATTTHTHALGTSNPAAFAQLREVWGVSGILLSTLILVVPLMFILRRARPALGAVTILGLAIGVLVPALGEFTQWTAGIAVAVAFGVADVVVRREQSTVVLGTVVALVFWAVYFIGLELTDGVRWSPSLWAGTIVLASMVGAAVGLLVSQGAAPSVAGATSGTSRPSSP